MPHEQLRAEASLATSQVGQRPVTIASGLKTSGGNGWPEGESHVGPREVVPAILSGRTLPRDETLRCLPEVVIQICVFLSRSDLKNLGRVSRRWAAAAQTVLFQTIFLRINLQSFERLHEIAQHRTLSKYVIKISYDERMLNANAAQRGFHEWLRFSAGSGLGLRQEEAQLQLLSQLDDHELGECYINYLESVFGQEYLLRRDNEQQRLVQALPQFTRLVVLEYVVPTGRDICMTSPTLPLNALSPRARAILAEPENYHGCSESDGHFWTLLRSACLSGHAQQLRTVLGSNLDLEQWNTAAAASLSNCSLALPALRRLSLEFVIAPHRDGDVTTLAGIIASATGLEALRLSFDTLWHEDCAVIRVSHIFPPIVQWDQLRHLSLQGFCATEECLQGLLQRHAATLQSLELSNMDFEPTQEESGSWIRFIHFLSEMLSLEHIRFDGCFSNKWDEGWITRNAEEERFGGPHRSKPENYDCLKYRIERFITHGGVSPFTAKEDRSDNRCDDYNGLPWYVDRLPWIFEEDDSWMFKPELIQ